MGQCAQKIYSYACNPNDALSNLMLHIIT